jgi:uncharacterized membrane protein YkvA (DUF1232 family)
VPRSDATTVLLRVEGAALLGASVFLYAWFGDGWVLFAVLLLAPDISLVGYAAGAAVGAVSYNLFHTTAIPAVVAVLGVALDSMILLSIALIWLAHIGMDRALRYGLKRASGFRDTHLGRIGRG